MPIKLAHVWSSDMGLVLSLAHMRHFLAQGWDVAALCPEGPRLDTVTRAGVRWLPISLSRRLLDPVGDAKATIEIVRHLRRERFDLVHTHNIKAGLIGRVAARLSGASRIVHTMHGMPFSRESPAPQRLAHAGLEWIACRFVDRILVQSEEDRRTVLEHCLIAPERVVHIGNGIPLERFDPAHVDGGPVRASLGLGPEDVLFVSAGRLVRSKGFVELADAAGQARASLPQVHVAIAGPRDAEKSDSLSDEEMTRARAAGVHFLGERDDMPAVYAAADVVVLPSWHEGMPRVLLEGAAMGKPLLATDVRGCREVVNLQTGDEVVPREDAAALAAAMLRLARDPARRRRAGEANRARARAEYDVAVVIERLARVYDELLGRHRGAA